jgi:hypothetical protein
MWAYSVRRVAFKCATVLLVAVTTAVTRWQPGVLRDDQRGSPLDPQKRATLTYGPGFASQPGPALCCWCRTVVCVVVTAVVSSQAVADVASYPECGAVVPDARLCPQRDIRSRCEHYRWRPPHSHLGSHPCSNGSQCRDRKSAATQSRPAAQAGRG